MPINRHALQRRRTLLQISQHNLAIVAGIHPTTISRIERGALPHDGGQIGIDVFMRIAEALQMEYHELLIPPTGNRYQRAVEFAANQNRKGAVPIPDNGRSVLARGMRKLTHATSSVDVEDVIARDEGDGVVAHTVERTISEPPEGDVDGYEGTVTDTTFQFLDPSSE